MDAADRLKRITRVAWLDATSIAKTNPLFLLGPFLIPLSLLLVMFLYTGDRNLAFLLAGAVVFQAINAGTIVFSDFSAQKIYFKLQDLYCASPARPSVYAYSKGLSRFLTNVPAALAYLALALYYSHAPLYVVPVIIVLLVFLLVVLTSLSFFASTLVSGETDVFMIGNIFTFTAFLLSPVYYPITALPAFAQPYAFLFPATGPALLTQWAFGLLAPAAWMVQLALLSMACYAVVAYAALRAARWREN
ncbi:hypothetical protein AUJ14_00155 [Candidatus Micrarchaeota archaeon CG1_02_55_22]|nr:MAG: hypothetical protein AUJ14_00155 [Candidatus Micrarchaeota archaeon CG1_02_55_22]